jgi:hypothetical protein
MGSYFVVFEHLIYSEKPIPLYCVYFRFHDGRKIFVKDFVSEHNARYHACAMHIKYPDYFPCFR